MAGLARGAPGTAPGLTDRRRGRRQTARGTRSYGDIVWSNTFTLFNLILGGLLALILAFGDWRDGLFGGVIIANTLIGIVQEVRAKRTLDRLALLVAPTARLVSDDGQVGEVPAEQVQVGDLVRLEPGDQVIADGTVQDARGLSLDESVLTGESDAVHKTPGDQVLSGAYCVAGSGTMRVQAVGADSYAERLAAEARGTRRDLSPLQHDINRVLRLTLWAMVPLAIALMTSLVIRGEGFVDSVPRIVAALVPLVPEGLVLLTSLTFAVAAVRLARLGAFAQRLNAVESLAGVDVVCIDKTGTLTDNRPTVSQVVALDGTDEVELRALLGTVAASVGERNSTMQAIQDAMPADPVALAGEVPFTSATKWSGVALDGAGGIVLGAPEVLRTRGVAIDSGARNQIDGFEAARRRVLLVARSDQAPSAETLPGYRAAGLVVMTEGLRDDAIQTVGYLRDQGTTLKVISGDAVATVQAVARDCGVPGSEHAVSGEDLPDDPAELERVADQTAIFGRITPEQKRDLIAALGRRGHYVAMMGDGVNDVLALKTAKLAIAMGSGSQIAKGVSDLILVRGGFSTVPAAIGAGQTILRNTHRVAQLFVTKSVYAAVLLATIGLAPIAYPFLPRHLTVTASLTIGIPAFFLALAPSAGPVRRERFIRNLLAFTVPAGLVIGAAIVAGYLLVRGPLDREVIDGRTAAVVIATALGLALVLGVERAGRGDIRWWVWAMVAGFVLVFTIGLSIAPLRDFFEVTAPDAATWGIIAAVSATGIAALVGVGRMVGIGRPDRDRLART